jgi:HlyD family secretion protein
MTPDKQALDDLRINRPARATQSPVIMIVVVLAIVVVAAIAFWWMKRPRTFEVRTITVSAPGSSSDRTLLNGSGYVTARREATVSSKITGKVLEVLIEEGMKVEAGQILARLDSANVEKGLQLVEAQAESARKGLDEIVANLERADRDLRRMKELVNQKIASESDLDRAQAEAKALKARFAKQQADVIVAEREIASWKQQLDDTVIRAPFTGIVTKKNAQPGEMISPVSAGTGFTRTGIGTIVDMSSLEVEVDVNQGFIDRVQPGQPVEAILDAYPDWRIPSKVIATIPTADRQKGTVKVRVGFEKLDPRILPDMFVKVAFQSAASPTNTVTRALTIPKSAVRQLDGRDIVWLAKDGRAERRAITVGATRGDEVTVTAGLNGGERLIVEGSDKLAEGSRITEGTR